MKISIYRTLLLSIPVMAMSLVNSNFASAIEITDDTVLVTTPRVKVTKWDLDAELLRFPYEDYFSIIASKSRLAQIVENIMIAKTLALEAQEKGMEKDKTVEQQLSVARNKILSSQLLTRRLEALPKSDYTARARELYLVNKDQFMTTPQIGTTHILIDLKTRSEEQAHNLAKEIHEKLIHGAKFADMVDQYSDDKGSSAQKGAIATAPATNFDPEYSAAALKLKIGEMSDPVRSQFGFHIIRLDTLIPGKPRAFDEIKEQLVAKVKGDAEKLYNDLYVTSIKTDRAIVVNTEALDTIRPDPSILKNAVANTEQKSEKKTELKPDTKPATSTKTGNNKVEAKKK